MLSFFPDLPLSPSTNLNESVDSFYIDSPGKAADLIAYLLSCRDIYIFKEDGQCGLFGTGMRIFGSNSAV
jgi:hypothetical protein